MADVFVGQSVTFTFTVRDQDGVLVDVFNSTTPKIVFKRVGSKATTYDADVDENNTWELAYTTTTLGNELDKPGEWYIQGIVTIGGEVFPTEIVSVTVKSILS